MKTILKGREGEQRAMDFLIQKGFVVQAQNYRHRHGEIDIIAFDNDVLVFVEVKYRQNDAFGFPEDFVTNQKISILRKTATHYILSKNWNGAIRFDIVAITGEKQIEHFEDAF